MGTLPAPKLLQVGDFPPQLLDHRAHMTDMIARTPILEQYGGS